MSLRAFPPLAVLCLVTLLSACSDGLSVDTGVASSPPERIVLIVIDTLRRDYVSAYGSRNPTPNIDALARRGQYFQNVLASFHQTTMSMASLFTGRTPSLESGQIGDPLDWNGRNWCGMRRFAREGEDESCIPASRVTLAESLGRAGYWTAGVVTNALMFRPRGYEQGFDEWIEVGGQAARSEGKRRDVFGKWTYHHRNGEAANRAVRRLLDSRPGDRFFLYVHLMDVHDYVHDPNVRYARGVALADRSVGELLDSLEERDLLRGSVVFLISDHGERLREPHFVKGERSHFGNPSFEEIVRIPLVVAPPIVRDPSVTLRSDDVYGLIQRVAGIVREDDADLEPGELFLSERRYQTYRRGRWKSYRERKSGVHHLVDVQADPRERRDVASLHPEIVERHGARMDELSKRLSISGVAPSGLSEEDRRLLRELGYLEDSN